MTEIQNHNILYNTYNYIKNILKYILFVYNIIYFLYYIITHIHTSLYLDKHTLLRLKGFLIPIIYLFHTLYI